MNVWLVSHAETFKFSTNLVGLLTIHIVTHRYFIDMANKKIQLRWSKKENDWLFNYPDNAGKSMMGVFFDMVKTTGHRTDWEQGLMTMLTERGYDYRTLRITCDKLPDSNGG